MAGCRRRSQRGMFSRCRHALSGPGEPRLGHRAPGVQTAGSWISRRSLRHSPAPVGNRLPVPRTSAIRRSVPPPYGPQRAPGGAGICSGVILAPWSQEMTWMRAIRARSSGGGPLRDSVMTAGGGKMPSSASCAFMTCEAVQTDPKLRAARGVTTPARPGHRSVRGCPHRCPQPARDLGSTPLR